MKKTLPIILTSLLSINIAHAAQATAGTQSTRVAANYIFFGDSLTDTGNMPQPSIYQSDKTNTLLKAYNLYVPISNPVPQSLYSDEVDQDNLPNFYYPSATFLKNSLNSDVILRTINGSPRVNYSINWPLYFVYNSEIQDSDNADNIMPLISWFKLEPQTDITDANINYAWAGAVVDSSDDPDSSKLATPACYNDNNSTKPAKPEDCNGQAILESIQAYSKQSQSTTDYKSTQSVEIPNLAEQISLLNNDISNKKVYINNKTQFYIYIGANDVSNFIKAHIYPPATCLAAKKSPKCNTQDYILTNTDWKNTNGKLFQLIDKKMNSVAESIKSSADTLISKNNTISPSQIHVLTLPSLEYLHETHSFTSIPVLGKRISVAFKYAEQALNSSIKNKMPSPYNVDDEPSNKLNKSFSFINNYDDCVGTEDWQIPGGGQANLAAANCEKYFSWNNAHLTTKANAYFAQGLIKSKTDSI